MRRRLRTHTSILRTGEVVRINGWDGVKNLPINTMLEARGGDKFLVKSDGNVWGAKNENGVVLFYSDGSGFRIIVEDRGRHHDHWIIGDYVVVESAQITLTV